MIATSTFGDEQISCNITLQDVYFFPKGDKGVVSNFYPGLIEEWSYVPADYYFQYPLSPYFWGPDIKYNLLNQSSSSKDLVQLENIVYPKPVDVHYEGKKLRTEYLQWVQQLPSGSQFNDYSYFSLEASDFEINFYECSVSPQRYEQVLCQTLHSETIQSQIVQLEVLNHHQFYVFQQLNENFLRVVNRRGKQVAQIQTQQGSRILSFSTSHTDVFVIAQNTTDQTYVIEFYHLQGENVSFVDSITNATAQSWGFQEGQFLPNKVVSLDNKNLFILNGNSKVLYVISNNNKFYLQYLEPNQNVRINNIFIAQQQLITVQESGITRQYIGSLPNVQSFQSQYTLDLYENNTLQGPSNKTVTVSSSGLFFYALAYTPGQNQTQVLILRPSADQFNTLFSLEVVLPGRINASQVIQVSANGNPTEDFLVILINGQKFTYYIPANKGIQFQLQSTAPTNSLLQEVQFNYSTQGNDGSEPIFNTSVPLYAFKTGLQVQLNLSNIYT